MYFTSITSAHCLSLWILLGALGIVTRAQAQISIVDEIEPNDSLLTAQPIPFPPITPSPFEPIEGLAIVNGAHLDPGNLDFYSMQFDYASAMTVRVLDFTPGIPLDNDSVLALFDSRGDILAFDDDGGAGSLSSIASLLVNPGTYYFGVSGGGDKDFLGLHSQDFAYQLRIDLVIFAVPGPSVFGGLLCGWLLAPRRRRG